MKYKEKEIKGFENYTINTKGEVFNTVTRKYRKIQKYPTGYMFVTLFKNGDSFTFLIHRLVAEAFIPNPQNKPQVGHWDCDRSNNTVENLYWCTAPENMDNPITRKNLSLARQGYVPSEETKKKMSETASKKIGELNNFYGHSHTDKFKEKASERMKKKLSSDPQFKEQFSKAAMIGRSKNYKKKDQIDPKTGEVIKMWDDYFEFAESEYDSTCVRRCCKGERATYKHSIWKYWA